MGYCIKFALSQMKHRKKRTFITMIGVMLSLILSFVIMSIWDSVEYYNLKEHNRMYGQTHLLIQLEEYYVPSEGKEELVSGNYIGREEIEQIREHPLVKEVYLAELWHPSPDVRTCEEADLDKIYDGIFIELKEGNQLRAQAEELSDDFMMEIVPVEAVEAGIGENALLPMPELILLLVALIFAICAMLMIRNALRTTTLERIREYGLCRCVGMEPKQIFGVLLTEAFILMLCSILLSIGGCMVLFRLLETWVNGALQELGMNAAFCFVWGKNLAWIVILGAVMAFVSVIEPVRCSLQKTPIDAIYGKINILPKSRKRLANYKKAEYVYAVRSIRNAPRRFIALFTGVLVIVFSFSIIMAMAESYTQEYAKVRNMPAHHEVYLVAEGYDYKWLIEDLKGKETVKEIELFSMAQECINGVHMVLGGYNEATINRMAGEGKEPNMYQTMLEEKGILYNVTGLSDSQTDGISFQEGDLVPILNKEGHEKLRNAIVSIIDITNEKCNLDLNKGYAKYSMEEKSDLFYDEDFYQACFTTAQSMGYHIENIPVFQKGSLFRLELELRRELTTYFIQQGYVDYYTVMGVMNDESLPAGFILTEQVYQENYTNAERLENGIYVWREYEGVSETTVKGEMISTRQKVLEETPYITTCSEIGDAILEIVTLNIGIKLLKKAALLLAIFFVLMIAVMLFNQVAGEMYQRKGELWTYAVLGMSRAQRIKMILAENLSAAFLGVLFGLELAWLSGFGILAVTYELDMKMKFIWPWSKILGGIAVVFVILVFAVILAISGKENRSKYKV